LLKQLQDQGLPLQNYLHTVFQAIVLSRLLYDFPAWGPLLNMESMNRIDSFLKRCHHCGFTIMNSYPYNHWLYGLFDYVYAVWLLIILQMLWQGIRQESLALTGHSDCWFK